MRPRESDSLVLPMKAGNAAGGKEATHGSAEMKHRPFTEAGNRWKRNCTA